jgi:hypothetical protein
MLHGINLQTISEATTMYVIVHSLMRFIFWLLHSTERGVAIFAHYQHHKGEVLDCEQKHCSTVFAKS